jgi:lipopolysaccharide assembly protein A
MRAIYWGAVIVIAALVALFAASNREIVSLQLWPLPFSVESRLFFVVLASLFIGFAVGALAVWLKGSRRRHELRECRRQNTALARELAATQARLAGEKG